MKKFCYSLFIVLILSSLSACTKHTHTTYLTAKINNKKVHIPEYVIKNYGPVENEPYYLPAIDISQIDPQFWRQNVYYPTTHEAGTIIIDTDNRHLYYILGDDQAIRYGIGVGKEGLALKGTVTISNKRKWPSWMPTPTMMRRDPDRYGNLGGGLAPGPSNPLGARALYLYRDGHDSLFRIHGSYEAWSIGQAMSSGCIRMLNHDVIDLYDRVTIGTKVIAI